MRTLTVLRLMQLILSLGLMGLVQRGEAASTPGTRSKGDSSVRMTTFQSAALGKLESAIQNSPTHFDVNLDESTQFHIADGEAALREFNRICLKSADNVSLKIQSKQNYVVYFFTCGKSDVTSLPMHFQFVLDRDSERLLRFSVFDVKPVALNFQVSRQECDMRNPGEFLGVLLVSSFLTVPIARALYPGEGDKWRHMLVGNWTAQSVNWGLRFFFDADGFKSALGGDLAALSAGLGGEFKDSLSPKQHVVEARDVYATANGGLINHLTVGMCSLLKNQRN